MRMKTTFAPFLFMWAVVLALPMSIAAAAPADADTTPPVIEDIQVSRASWKVDGVQSYQFTVVARDEESGVGGLRAAVNLHGSNRENLRGNFAWSEGASGLGLASWGESVACEGGGVAEKYVGKARGGYGGQYVSLAGCAASELDGRRSVTFTVRPTADFGEFAENDISASARDRASNGLPWTAFDLNFATDATVPVLNTLSVSRSTWYLDGTHVYAIQAAVSDEAAGVEQIRWRINRGGSNAENPRGLFLWREGGYSLPSAESGNRVACHGAGFAEKYVGPGLRGLGFEHVDLVGCVATGTRERRFVTLHVRPAATFGEFAENDVSLRARDDAGHLTPWTHYDVNFSTAALESKSRRAAVPASVSFEGLVNQVPTDAYGDQGLELLNFVALPNAGQGFACNNGSETTGSVLAPPGYINVPSGFTTVRMIYAQAPASSAGFEVWSGLNGTGVKVLSFGFIPHPNNGDDNAGGCRFDSWLQTGELAATGRSIVFYENDGDPQTTRNGVDDIVFTVNEAAVLVDPGTGVVPEGHDQGLTVGLSLSEPVPAGRTVEVTLQRVSGGSGGEALGVIGSATAVFTSSNWDRPQGITLWAPENDQDNENDRVTFEAGKTGGSSVLRVASASVTVQEIDDDFALSVGTGGQTGGSILVDPGPLVNAYIDVNDGQWHGIALTAEPMEDYAFDRWSVLTTAESTSPDILPADGSLTLQGGVGANPTSIGDVQLNSQGATAFSIDALFATVDDVAVTVDRDGQGTVWVDGIEVPAGGTTQVPRAQRVLLQATAAPGYTFQGWTSVPGGIVENPSAESTYLRTQVPSTITARFEFVGLRLEIRSTTGGDTSPPGPLQGLQVGQTVHVTAQPRPGYVLNRWVQIAGSVTIADPTASTTTVTVLESSIIEARFKAEEPGLLQVTVTDLDTPGTSHVFRDESEMFQYLEVEKLANAGDGDPRRFKLEFVNAGQGQLVVETVALIQEVFSGFCLRAPVPGSAAPPALPEPALDPCPLEQPLSDEPLHHPNQGPPATLFLDFGNPVSFPDEPGVVYETALGTVFEGSVTRPVVGFRGLVQGNADVARIRIEYLQESDYASQPNRVPIAPGDTVNLGAFDAGVDHVFDFQVCNDDPDLDFSADLIVENTAGVNANFGFFLETQSTIVVPPGTECVEFSIRLVSEPDSEVVHTADVHVGKADDIFPFSIRAEVGEGPAIEVRAPGESGGGIAWLPVPNRGHHSLTPMASSHGGAVYRVEIHNTDHSENLEVKDLSLFCGLVSSNRQFSLYRGLHADPLAILPGTLESFEIALEGEAGVYIGTVCFEYRTPGMSWRTFEFDISGSIDITVVIPDIEFDIPIPDGPPPGPQPVANYENVFLPSISVGEGVAVSLGFRNGGSTTEGDLTVDVDPQIGAGFSVDQLSLNVAPGDRQVLEIAFAAATAGVFEGTVRLATSDPALPEFVLFLTVPVGPDTPELSVESQRLVGSELRWVAVPAGEPAYLPSVYRGGAIQHLRLRTTTAVELVGIDVQTSPPDRGAFSMGHGASGIPGSLSQGGAAPFSVRLDGDVRPGDAYDGFVTVRYRRSGGGQILPYVLPLRGYIRNAYLLPYVDPQDGTGVDLLAQHGRFNLPRAQEGETVSREIGLAHSGPTLSAPLTIEVETEGTGFAASPTSLTLSYGQTATLEVSYAATAPGDFGGLLRLTTSDEPVLGVFFQELMVSVIPPDNTPPSAPGDTSSPDCLSVAGNTCFVADADFAIQVTPATDSGGSGLNPSGYRICRSNDTAGWGGCDVSITQSGSTSVVVSGAHRPPPGKRRAYYFHATDNAGNAGDWNGPLYVETQAAATDTTPPSAPGDTTSPDCLSISGNTCFVDDANFTIQVAPATDAGGSGVNPSGYRICRSNDTTGWGGCDVGITQSGSTSIVIAGAHRPPPGKRRAYYFHATDNVGNVGDWNGPLYVETQAAADATPPSSPGDTTSPDCLSVAGDTCFVADTSFTIQVAPATDSGGSGVNPSGYRICRSNDTPGWGGCDVNITQSGSASVVVSGAHRPPPGKRRAYYFRASDNAGNVGDWNGPLYVETHAAADTTPPSAPGNTVSPSCLSVSGNTCLVADADFTLQVAPATDAGGSGVNPSGYRICRSHDTTTWGGCDVNITQSGSTSIVVSGAHRPPPGKRRAYYFRASDNAGNAGDWNGPLYVETQAPTADTTPPSAPGNTVSPSCLSVSGNTCLVADADFTLQVAPATDAGGSGVNPSGYRICRSHDTTSWGGCDVNITQSGSTSIVVSGAHRPPPGKRRAYYFRASDNAGNAGDWNGPLYVETQAPTANTTPPSAPGNTVSPSCLSVSGNTCLVADADFTLQVAPATDAGGSGVNPSGYRICRSHDTTTWGGCDVNITQSGSTSIVVSGAHRPAPGKRRAYYFRASDNAGNAGDWNGPLYVQTQ